VRAQTYATAIAWFGLVLVSGACRPPATADDTTPPPTVSDSAVREEVEALFGPVRVEQLQELADAADAAPGDFNARRESGMAHMWATLGGVLELQPRAEADLEAAFDLDPTDAALTRSLGRFYNMRAVAGDRSKADRQVEVYAAHLGGRKVGTLSDFDFVAWSFSRLGAILDLRNRGRLLAALSEIEALEDSLAARVAAHPDNVELHALAGNFAFFFAGNVPMGRVERVQTAVAHFEVVRERWDELRRGAKHERLCPNTRENFMFELAEGYLVLEQPDKAAPIHRELTEIREPATRAKEQIAEVSAERLEHADRYVGDMDLMPPWPSDVGNCVVCHAWTRDVPMDSLYTAKR